MKSRVNYKFYEDKLIQELQEYVDKTYDQHYATDKYQATDVIIDSGHGTGFCLGNVIKYAKRYGNKGSPCDARKDLMKILHYTLIQLYIHDQENQSTATSPKEDPRYLGLIPTPVCGVPADDIFSKGYASIDAATPQDWNNLR